MALTDYTTYDQIRAILSVTDDELEDCTLALPIFLTNVQEQMEVVSPDLEDTYTDLMQMAESTRSKKQARLYRLIQAFAAYAVSVQLLDSLPLLAVKSEQDARAQYERFEKPFERVDAATRAAFVVVKGRLVDAWNALMDTPLAVPSYERTWTSTAGLAIDPVTNE